MYQRRTTAGDVCCGLYRRYFLRDRVPPCRHGGEQIEPDERFYPLGGRKETGDGGTVEGSRPKDHNDRYSDGSAVVHL